MAELFHTMVLSAGSLLGQNILDAAKGHRHKLRLTGVDSNADNPRLFRYDRVYISPLTTSPRFKDFLLDLIERESPHLILAGRDHDTLELAELAQRFPKLQQRIIGGKPEAVLVMNNKRLSYQFSLERSLPFVPTCFIGDGNNTKSVYKWAQTHGYPILAKPEMGFGSLGLRILCDERQLSSFIARHGKGHILQKYIDLTPERQQYIDDYFRDIDCGVPFFIHLPEERQYAGQTIIEPDGTIGTIFTSINQMVIGRCERSSVYSDPKLISITQKYAEAMAAFGWRGMFNLQCRKTPDGYMAHEMNGRMSGSTSARRWLGYDELRELIRLYFNVDIGRDIRGDGNPEGKVYRSLTDYYVSDKERDSLIQYGVWSQHPSEQQV